MPKRIAVSTGGGDAPGLNAVIRAVVRAACARGWEVFGIRDGYDGILDRDPQGILPLNEESVRGILPRGGTILGTTNRGNPFAAKVREGDTVREVDRSRDVVQALAEMGVDALVTIGGDGSLRIAEGLSRLGVPIVGVPKTIDNDLAETETTFGFDTALSIASEALDRLHTTAESHHRVMILEVMGRHAGWIALHAGLAGGADIILIPEIPFEVGAVVRQVDRRGRAGRAFSIVVMAEGAAPRGGQPVYQEAGRLGGVCGWLSGELTGRVNHEVRATILGHLQRGGTPTARDRILGTRFGVRAVELVEEGCFGHMVALQADEVVAVPLARAVAYPKLVDPGCELVRTARAIGVSFGDE